MSVYKLMRCKSCTYKKREKRPTKLSACECGGVLYYSPNWYFSYTFRKKRYEKVAGPDKRIAQEKERKKLVEIAEGTANLPASWNKAVERLERTYRDLSPNTVSMYQNCLKRLSAFFGHLKLADITEDDLMDYKFLRSEANISGALFNRERSTLKRLFALTGVSWNFGKAVFKPEKEKSRDRFLDTEERVRLIRACKSNKLLYTVIMTGLDTGLRKTSLFTLQWRDINMKDNLITKAGKGGKIHRIPLTQRLRNLLMEYRKSQKVLSMWVFPSPLDKGKPIKDIRRSFQTVCKTAGVKELHFHDLRRTFATWLAMKTKDIVLVQEMLGHSNVETTRRHYAHLTDDHKRDGMDIYERSTGAI